MRRLRRSALCLPVLIFAMLPLLAHASSNEAHIGLYLDENGTTCGADYTPYNNITIYILLYTDNSDGVTAAEFRLNNLPAYPSSGYITFAWNSILHIISGSGVEDNIALAYMNAQYDTWVVLGSMDMMGFATNWLGAEHRITVEKGLDKDKISYVDGNYEEHDLWGSAFTFNGSGDIHFCGQGIPLAANWSKVKSLY
ncbi:MAG: hypothetical protein GY835_20335 [bacterium]|nr:hypothetical protein [bacterium]